MIQQLPRLDKYLKRACAWRTADDVRNIYIPLFCSHTITPETETRRTWGIAIQAHLPGPRFDLTPVVIDSKGVNDLRRYNVSPAGEWKQGKNMSPSETTLTAAAAARQMMTKLPPIIEHGAELAACMGHPIRVVIHPAGDCPKCEIWAKDTIIPNGKL